jgi:hypothetical protein
MITHEMCAKAALEYLKNSTFQDYEILRILGRAFMSGCLWMAEQKQKEDEVKIDRILLQLKKNEKLIKQCL